MRKDYCDDKYIRYVYGNKNINNKIVRKIVSFFRYPNIGIMDVIIKLERRKCTNCTDEDLKAIKKIYNSNR
jgi:hypothetical protein